MSECMTFPDTVEEFMDSYKIVDTEQVYTNGMEMVPIYRMRQWFEHEPEIIHCRECVYGEQDYDGWWYCRSFGCQIGDKDGSGFCADAERKDNV